MRAQVVPAAAGHIDHLASNLRLRDKEEVFAAAGMCPRVALLQSLLYSDTAWTCMYDGKPAGMFGCAPSKEGEHVGSAWLLATDDIEKFRKTAWRLSRYYAAKMHERYAVLYNYVDYRNVRSLYWLERLGFVPVDAELEYGFERRLFIKYESRRQPCV